MKKFGDLLVGIGTVLLYGILTYIGAFIVLFITTILTAFIMAK